MADSNILPHDQFYSDFCTDKLSSTTDHHLILSLIQGPNHPYTVKSEPIPQMWDSINSMLPLVNSSDYHPAMVSDMQQCYGISADCVTVPALSESDNWGFHDDFASANCHVFEPGDYYQYYCSTGFLTPNINNPTPATHYYNRELEIQVKPEGSKNHEETEVKVGRYSAEEKKDRIMRYLKKRNQRNFNKTIKYVCRKTLADKRIRIGGRFAKNCTSAEEDETAVVIKSTDNSYSEETNSFYQDSIFSPMKYDEEEEWFETAMANLMHLP